jgi:NodT family efflux transporter outer membrane factor (OMF) lipoprotein
MAVRRTSLLGAGVAGAFALGLAACSMAPPLKVPEIPAADAYKEAAPWTVAAPADTLARDAWWALYRDDDLNAMEKQLVVNSPDLAAAFARYQQARALADQSRSSLFPTVSANGSAIRNRQSDMAPLRVRGPNSPNDYSAYALDAQINYEFDLWGRVRNLVEAGKANERAAQADLESARLSLQAQLADTYIALRGLDREVKLLEDSVTAYQKALDLTVQRHDGGIASGLDVARAQTQLESTRSQVKQTIAQRALTEHAIAALVGESASRYSIAPRLVDVPLPKIPIGLPSTLLQRRPDIAAAERRMAAANAGIGVAKAAYFPQITLSAILGYESTAFGELVRSPNTFWAWGPSLALTLFDAGRRDAEVRRTQAVLDENAANYRGVVLAAFQQVEDNLALLNHYRTAAEAERAALAAAQKSLGYATDRYREGAVNYLEVVTSQTDALQAERNALDLETRERRASVQLIRALGGGWSIDTEPPVAISAACSEAAACPAPR